MTVKYVVIDEVHALARTKRGADLAIPLERLAEHSECDPTRVALSATCRPNHTAIQFVAGTMRNCKAIHALPPLGTPPDKIAVECLIKPGGAPHRGLSYRRLIRHLRQSISYNCTTVSPTPVPWRKNLHTTYVKNRIFQPSPNKPLLLIAHHSMQQDVARWNRVCEMEKFA
jgi:hypothetical protein